MTFGYVCYGCFGDTSASPCPYCGFDRTKSPQPGGALAFGVILCGRYTVGRVLSMGEMGISYLGFDLTEKRKVMIKEYMPLGAAVRASNGRSVLASPAEAKPRFLEGVDAFLKETRSLRALKAVVCLAPSETDFIENNTVYAVFPFIEGHTLAQEVANRGPYVYEEAMQLFVPLMRALSACHARELLHLGVTPDNILLPEPDRAVLVNFSAARFLWSEAPTQTLHSSFMPPELASNPPHPGPWSDIYGVVASLYFALTGLIPGSTPLPLMECGVELPHSASDAVQRVLTSTPEERSMDMSALIAALSGRELPAQSTEPVVSEDSSAQKELWRSGTERVHEAGRNREIFQIVRPPDKNQSRVELSAEARAAYSVGGDPEALNADVGFVPRMKRWYARNLDKLKFSAWMAALCAIVLLVIGVLIAIFPELRGEAVEAYVPEASTSYSHRWLGLRLQVPSDFVVSETEESVRFEVNGQATVQIDFVAFCETPLFSREDFLRSREQIEAAYFPEHGVERFQELETGYNWDIGSTVVRVTGECVYDSRPSTCTLYIMDTTNGFGCYFITVTHRTADPNYNAVQQAVVDCISSAEITARVKTTLRFGESNDFGLRFLYDGSLLDYEFSTSLGGAALTLYTRDGTFHSINIMPLTDVSNLEQYEQQQNAVILSALGDRLNKSLSFSVRSLFNVWEGSEYRYDRDGASFTTRQEMYGNVGGEFVNLYFYGDSDTHVDLQQAAQFIMQTMTFA